MEWSSWIQSIVPMVMLMEFSLVLFRMSAESESRSKDIEKKDKKE